jgi:hypothetical protein
MDERGPRSNGRFQRPGLFRNPPGIQFCEANGRVTGILNPAEDGVVTELTVAGKNLDRL